MTETAARKIEEINGWPLWLVSLLALMSGGLLATTQAPLSFAWAFLLALPIAGWLLRGVAGPWRGFMLGWTIGTVYFAGSMFWILEPFQVEPEKYGWMAPFALALMALGLALFWATAFGLATVLGEGAARILWLAVLWTGFEALRAVIFTGFPWGLIAYGWSETPIFQTLAYVGPHGLGLMTLVLGLCPALWHRWMIGVPLGVIVMLAGFSTLWANGADRLRQEVGVRDVTVRLIQPNVPQAEKWQPEKMRAFFERGLDLTSAAPTHVKVDAVIWPETSLPFLMGENADAMAQVIDAAKGADVIAGIRRVDGRRLFNTLGHWDGSGDLRARYDKHHLVPFGEYVPFGEWAARFGIYGLAASDGAGFSAGARGRVIEPQNLPRYLPLICYEVIFPRLMHVAGSRQSWAVHITNDAWFGNFSGPYQHLVQVRARAIEQGLPIARSANTGVSAMIDPLGRITASIPLNTAGFVDAALPGSLPKTWYSKTLMGGWVLLALIWAALAIFVATKMRRREAASVKTI